MEFGLLLYKYKLYIFFFFNILCVIRLIDSDSFEKINVNIRKFKNIDN